MGRRSLSCPVLCGAVPALSVQILYSKLQKPPAGSPSHYVHNRALKLRKYRHTRYRAGGLRTVAEQLGTSKGGRDIWRKWGGMNGMRFPACNSSGANGCHLLDPLPACVSLQARWFIPAVTRLAACKAVRGADRAVSTQAGGLPSYSTVAVS